MGEQTIDTTSPVMIARTALLDAIAKHKRAEVRIKDLYAAADAYIFEIRAHGKRIGRTVPVPSRAGVIRQLS